MARAVCVRCGARKSRYDDQCLECGLLPVEAGLEVLARSLYLSVDRYDGEMERRRYAATLDSIGERLRNGECVDFDSEELQRLSDFFSEGQGWSLADSYRMLGLLCLWLGTPIAVLVFLLWLLARMRGVGA